MASEYQNSRLRRVRTLGSYEMSLGGCGGMLGIDQQHGRYGSEKACVRWRRFLGESGAMEFAGRSCDEVCIDGEDVGAALLRYPEPVGEGSGAPVSGARDGTGPRSGHTSDHELHRMRGEAAVYQRTKFPTRYTSRDVELLACVDKSHGNLSGPAGSGGQRSPARTSVEEPMPEPQNHQAGVAPPLLSGSERPR